MALQVEIDGAAGFCGGVIRAIGRAEAFLDAAPDRALYSLGSIVHNGEELARLSRKGLVPVSMEDLPQLHPGDTVLIRAHGEPPRTYERIRELGLAEIDCTCPVVLALQKEILAAHGRTAPVGGRIVIFGKVGHAEVLGLLGQVDGDASVVENLPMLEKAVQEGSIRLDAPVEVFSQTTKNPQEYEALCAWLSDRAKGGLRVHDTICRQVALRHGRLAAFAADHDVVVFVAGEESSNGRVLSDLCRANNPATHVVASAASLDAAWFHPGDSVGVSGATSTPRWLLESVARSIENLAV